MRVGILTLFLSSLSLASQTGYVGSAVCRTCHPDVNLNFFKNPHYRSTAAGAAKPENQGCESCHGPGKAHVEARGGKATIVAFSQLAPQQTLDNCLRCHQNNLSRANIRRSDHTQADVVCTNCHSIHRPASLKNLLAKDQTTLCYQCHPSIRAQFNMPVKHRVNEGFMTCTDCHNPHGADAPTWRMGVRPRMVTQALGNEQPCLKCHQNQRGPFAFEHPAVRVDGCESCHAPHGSMNARLLRRPAVFTLCLECHNGGGNFGRQGDGVKIQSASHNMADPKYQNCTLCHVRIHGSNSSPQFLR
ncbi:MAG TPA: cytochrome C [Solibacterales bacterium]|nr:cytochrome C [Bryobacterales bacterium]